MANYTGSNTLDDVMGAGTGSAGTGASDRWSSGAGNDTFVYQLSNAGGADRYSGGLGKDTVEFRLTTAEWANAATQANLVAFKAAVDTKVLGYAAGELPAGVGYTPLSFGIGKSLTVLEAESVRVYVNNVLVLGPPPASTVGTVKEAGVDLAYATLPGTPQASGFMPMLDSNGDTIPSGSSWSFVGINGAPFDADIYSTLGTGGTGFSITPKGQWTYTLDNADVDTQDLQDGGVRTLSFKVAATEAVSNSTLFSNVTITLYGSNDVQTVVVAGSDFAVAERGGVGNSGLGPDGDGASGTLALTNVDNTPAVVPVDSFEAVGSVTMKGLYGDLTVTRTGPQATSALSDDLSHATWSYVLRNGDAVVQALAGGQVVFDAISLPANKFDGASNLITIRVTGADDLAVISAGISDLTVKEAGGIQNAAAGDAHAGGSFSQTDPDTPGPLSFAPLSTTPLDNDGFRVDVYASAGRYGNFTLNTITGVWAYTLDNNRPATQALQQLYDLQGPVAVATETLTVRSSVSATATQTITVSIFGADDGVSSLANSYTGQGPSVTESTPADTTASGSLAAFDPDGRFVENAGSVLAGVFTAPAGLPYLVIGVDSPYTAAGPNQRSYQGQYGDFLLDTLSGLWTYTVASNLNPDGGAVDYLDIEALAGGQTATEVMLVGSNDAGAFTAVAVTLIGRDDPATLVHTLLDGTALSEQPVNPVAEVIEAGGVANANDPDPVASGRVLSIDIDAGESGWSATAAGSLAGNYGNFTFDSTTGDWTYRLRNGQPQVQQLTPASSVTDTLSLNSKDGTPHALTVLVRGANDTAIITLNTGVTLDLAVKEAGGSADGLVFDPLASGDLEVTDMDGAGALTEARFRAVPVVNPDYGLNDLTGLYGLFTFNANTGSWTYTLDNQAAATQNLYEGQIVSDTLVVYSKDVSASHVITVMIEGSYDQVDLHNAYGPDEATAGAQVRAEGTWRNASGAATAVVADYNAAGQLSGSPTGAYLVPPAALLVGVYGSFSFSADGAWSYRLNNEDPDTLALVSALDGAGSPVRSAQDFLTVSSSTDPTHPSPETYTLAVDVFGAYTVVDYRGLVGDKLSPNIGGAAAAGALPAIHGNGSITFTVRNGDVGETLGLYAGNPIPTPFAWGTVPVHDGSQTTVSMPVGPASSSPGVINQILHVWDGDQGQPASPALNLGVSIAQGTVASDTIAMIGSGGLAAGYAGNDRITGTSWADYMDGGEHDDTLLGGSGNDTLLGGNGSDELQGQANDDRLEGGAGQDTLDGGAGNDVLVPGPGRDRLTGGDGNDSFVFGSGPYGSPTEDDVVTDYSVTDDSLWFDQGLLLNAGTSALALAGPEWFNTASAAQITTQTYETNDRFIYDATQGLLYYDPDGGGPSGPLAPLLVAAFNGSPALVYTEFVFGPAPGP